MRTNRTTLRHAAAFVLLAGAVPLGRAPLMAQATTTGQIVGTLLDAAGGRVADPSVTLFRDGVVIRVARGALDGSFRFPGLPPGRYAVLAEQAGYQPVRLREIPVTAGAITTVVLPLERRPPPIDRVEERRYEGVVSTGMAASLDGGALERFDRRREATDLGRDVTSLAAPFDQTAGLAIAANGLAPAASQLVVDGLEESLLRHPGLPGEAAVAPIFARDGILQASVAGFAPESDVPGTVGATMSLVSDLGGGAGKVRPWVTYEGSSLGGAAIDNPADSSASSLRAGVALGGRIKGDTGGWFLRMDYRALQQPTAEPLDGADAALLDNIAAAAAPTGVESFLRPGVRTYTGLSGQLGGRYNFGDAVRITARLGGARWEEDAPLLASSSVSGVGSRVESRDISGAIGLDYADEILASVTRIGFRSSNREWFATSTPFTSLGAEGLAFGAAAGLPGTFDESMIQAVQLVTLPLERHEVRVGAMVGRRSFTYDWLPDGAGRAAFGSLADFELGQGLFAQATARDDARQIALTESALFADGVLRLSPALDLEAGFRYQVERAPTDLTVPDSAFTAVFGVTNAMPIVSRASSFGPRGGLTFRPGASGRTVLRLIGGLTPGHWDRAALAEVSRFDGGVDVIRRLGQVDWPGGPGGASARSLALFGDELRTPRGFTLEGMLRHALPGGTTLSLTGSYRHTDYLLRRADLNRPAAPLATTGDLRPVWGQLEQVGALVAPTPGSNARFEDYDRVYGLTSSGYADIYEVTTTVTREVGRGVSFRGSYTWSRAEDNLVGQRSADPADRLSPLDGGAGIAAWDDGRSDLDIPHRLAASLAWRSPSGMLTVGARVRMRSGLPFTAGFPPGTDVNGDGSSANDPVAVRSVPGLEGLLRDAGCEIGTSPFAVRNGCREDAVRALDLQAAVRLPVGARGIVLTVDAYNLASSATGLVDRAALHVDPDGSITTNTAGQLVLPLTLNADFGRLLARRNDPRTLRIGLRVEN
ncbi:MAG TPA: carboxypeptidase-like regulatory domain-containing protein [Gemmatimonadales bacterium]|nr:carboxypeptidase-like regulatory domain-containing protein [Gemmatimonadales bacterium]